MNKHALVAHRTAIRSGWIAAASLVAAVLLGFSQGAYAFSAKFGDICSAFSSGDGYNCILKPDGNITCWGDSEHGETNPYTGRDAIGISAGGHHACVLKAGGYVTCWGFNDYGQASSYVGGDAVGVSAGGFHTCVLKSDGNVACWGYNGWGQTNPYTGGDAVGLSAGDHHTCVLKSNGNVACWGQLNFSYSSGDAIGVSAGRTNTCVLKSDGNITCQWGGNFYTSGDAIGVSVGLYHSCVLKSDGNVACGLDNDHGEANPYTGGDAVGFSAGGHHNCVLKSDGNVECWGYNNFGQANPYTGGDAVCTLPSTVTIDIDIQPGSDVNSINLDKKGKIPVVILSTESFDATSVNQSTVHFGTATVINATVKDVNEDGRPDLVLQFNAKDTGIACGDTSATLTGTTADGKSVKGTDDIRTICK